MTKDFQCDKGQSSQSLNSQEKRLTKKKKLLQYEVSDPRKHQITHETLKERATQWLRRHPYEAKRGKIQKLARYLGLDYKTHRDYLYQISSKAKTEISYGAAPKSPSSQHDWIAVGNVRFALDRKGFPEIENSALKLGWKRSKNRNKELKFTDKSGLGTVRWWTTGRVNIQVKAPHTFSRAKQLAANAFVANKLILDNEKANRFLDNIHWHSSHDVWKTPNGQTLPYVRIDAYKKTLGFEVILGDSSHRDSVEIIVCPEMYERMMLQLEAVQNALNLILNTVLHESRLIEHYSEERQ